MFGLGRTFQDCVPFSVSLLCIGAATKIFGPRVLGLEAPFVSEEAILAWKSSQTLLIKSDESSA